MPISRVAMGRTGTVPSPWRRRGNGTRSQDWRRTSRAVRRSSWSASWAGSAVAKMASNEGQFGPFPAALRAIAEAAPGLNRYPESGGDLRDALAARHGVEPERIATGNGADAVIGHLSHGAARRRATRSPAAGRRSSPTGWRAAKLGATSTAGRRWPALPTTWTRWLAAVGPRTRIVYVCNPNNPTGGIVRRDELAALRGRGARAGAGRARRGVPRVRRGRRLPGRRAPSGATGPTSACCGRSRRCTGWPDCGWATPSRRPPWRGRWPRCARRSTSTSWPTWRPSPAWTTAGEVARRRALTVAGRDGLRDAFAALGLDVAEAHGNFLCVEVGDGPRRRRAAGGGGRHRPPARPLRRPAVDPRHGGHAGGERAVRGRTRPRARGGALSPRPQADAGGAGRRRPGRRQARRGAGDQPGRGPRPARRRAGARDLSADRAAPLWPASPGRPGWASRA